MRLLLILPLLTACAHAPAELEAAKASVDSHYTYSYRMTSMVTERARPEDGTANCTKYALEYLKAVSRGTPIICITPWGEKHRAVVVGDWVLDNRYNMVVPLNGYDCKLI